MEEADTDERTRQFYEVLTKFVEHCDELSNEDEPSGDGFAREFRVLRELGLRMREENTYPADEGKKPHNIKKNRYKDILPFDYTRVVLDKVEGQEGSDYINANFIKNPFDGRAYIASQGPLPTSVNDFWRMIWQYRVKVVAMACKLVELGKKKCEQYWPSDVGETWEFGNIAVTLNEEDNMAENCTVRQLKVTQKDQPDDTLEVTQFHYTGWPDHDIPDDIDVILEMIASMREMRHKDVEEAPIVVHCSAGCGRTGTICAIDYAWDLLKTGKLKSDFSLYEIIKHMREQRQSMIQAPEQYKMAHLTVKRLFEEHLEMLQEHEYANFEFPGNQETNTSKESSVVSESPDSRRRHSAYKTQITETIGNYVNMNFQGSNLALIHNENKPGASAASSTEKTLLSPSIKEKMAMFSEKPEVKENVQVAREVKQGRSDPVNHINDSSPAKKSPPRSRPEIPSNKPILSSTEPTSVTPSVTNPNNVKPTNQRAPMTRSISSINDGGVHRTVISIQRAEPGKDESSTQKDHPPTKSKSLPTKPQEASSSTFYHTLEPETSSVDQKTDQLNLSEGLYSEVGNSSFYSSVKETGERTLPANKSGSTPEPSDSDIYAVVNKSSLKQSTPATADNSLYDEVRPETNGSFMGEAPPIPGRGYLQPEPTPETEKASNGEVSKRQVVMQKFKNWLPGMKSSGSTSEPISKDIPGFNTRVQKKPSGPRDPPANWSNKSK